MRVFISAGEASGDAYGAALAREMRRLVDRGTFPKALHHLAYEGIGGPRMRHEGISLHTDSSHWGAISATQSLKIAPRVLASYYRAKRALARNEPGLFVAIDFGYANIRLARHARNHGWKVLYFVPPSSWRRDKQGKDLPKITDAISTPFPWSADILNRMGANAHWFGHPIKQLLIDQHSNTPTLQRSTTLAILPGSRRAEIDENLPVLAEALGDWQETFEFALAPSTDLADFERKWSRLAPNREDRFTVGDTYGVLSRAQAAVVCSGTATLEAALCRCPMVVVYRVSRMVEVEAKLVGFKLPKFISLPNILLDRNLVPELVQENATPANIRNWVEKLRTESERQRQIEGFEELDTLLGPDDAITRTAELALSLVASPTDSAP